MDIQAFLMENVPKMEAEEVWVSGRFSEPFRIRGISEEENARLRAGCRTRDGLDGVDAGLYLARLAAACVVKPDLEDADLQRSWGVMGADALLRRMLSAGEYARLLERVQAACGFDATVQEMADELKNGSCRATKNSTTPTTPCMNADSGRENLPK